jgi:hypothetical protein
MPRMPNCVSVSVSLLLLAACGGGGSGGGAAYLSWTDSDNGTVVLDANGDAFQFSASTGCMFSKTNGLGPASFCLSQSSGSSTGFSAYGPTDCSSPSSNPACDAASFSVALTNDPAKAGSCIAVLTNGTSSSTSESPLAVTSVAGGFDITTASSATAWTGYWNDVVPICGGSSPYAGTYAGEYLNVGYVVSGVASICVGVSNGSGQLPSPNQSTTLTVDSGGIINDDTNKLTGTIGSQGSGQFIAPSVAANSSSSTCVPTVTITGAAKNPSGKWVLAGTETFAGYTGVAVTFTQQ